MQPLGRRLRLGALCLCMLQLLGAGLHAFMPALYSVEPCGAALRWSPKHVRIFSHHAGFDQITGCHAWVTDVTYL